MRVGYLLVALAGVGLGCAGSSSGECDCPEGQTCVDGTCAIPCNTRDDCRPSWVCDEGVCLLPLTDADTIVVSGHDCHPDDEGNVRRCGETDVGPCQFGEALCVQGLWGACAGDLLPENEVCDNGIDEDCDGAADDGCACPAMATRPCGTDVGECIAGTQTCAGAAWGPCNGNVDATTESCDGLDNDCDGTPDNGLIAPAADNPDGVCAGSVKVCGAQMGWQEPAYTALMGYEVLEISCDGLDNDCDGAADVGLTPPPADKTLGVCVGQTKTCGGVMGWIEPDYNLVMFHEDPETSCGDGFDNDCDGAADPTLPTALNSPMACSNTDITLTWGSGQPGGTYTVEIDYGTGFVTTGISNVTGSQATLNSIGAGTFDWRVTHTTGSCSATAMSTVTPSAGVEVFTGFYSCGTSPCTVADCSSWNAMMGVCSGGILTGGNGYHSGVPCPFDAYVIHNNSTCGPECNGCATNNGGSQTCSFGDGTGTVGYYCVANVMMRPCP